MVRSSGWPGLGKTREKRYAFIKSFADEGYELADLTLRLFEFGAEGEWYRFFIDSKAWQRLKVLADQGDSSAQCLYVKAGRKWNRLTQKKVRKYTALATQQGNHTMQLSFISDYARGRSDYSLDLGKAYC